MKKLIIALLAVLCCVSCGRGTQTPKESAQVDSLKQAIARQDTLITSVFSSLDSIVSNLHTIEQREGIIAVTVAESTDGSDNLTRISHYIEAIDELLLENRRVMTRLKGDVEGLRAANIQVDALEKLIEQLSSQIRTSDSQIAELRSQLNERNLQVHCLDGAVAGLTERGEVLENQVRATSDLLNIAYYILGPRQDLLYNNVITRTGFIGRTLKVNDNCSLDSFIKIDIRSFDRMRIEGHDPSLVSTHPRRSYEFKEDGFGVMWLNVLDKSTFWKYTKVLVVSYK